MFSCESINNSDPNVFSFLRRSGKSSVLVSLNFSRDAQAATVLGTASKLTTLRSTSGLEP